jgi:hypothetical protein
VKMEEDQKGDGNIYLRCDLSSLSVRMPAVSSKPLNVAYHFNLSLFYKEHTSRPHWDSIPGPSSS